jgi:hypothetical protein
MRVEYSELAIGELNKIAADNHAFDNDMKREVGEI